ncbi:MAG: MMPL family transporter [Verrucomicrobiota bacterium]
MVVETGRAKGVLDEETKDAIISFESLLDEEFVAVLGLKDAIEEYSPIQEMVRRSSFAGATSMEAFLRPNFIDFDASRALLRVRSDKLSSLELREVEATIDQLRKDTLPEFCSITVTGEQVLLASLSDSVCRQLLINLCILALIVALSIALLFRSLRLGLLSLIPNTFPVVAVFGTMGFLDAPFGIGTFPVVLIAFAVAVDDTIHLMARFQSLSQNDENGEDIFSLTFREEAHPVLTTSIALCLGYLVTSFSAIPLNREIGLLFAFAILVALFADLFLTPSMLALTSRKASKRSEP